MKLIIERSGKKRLEGASKDQILNNQNEILSIYKKCLYLRTKNEVDKFFYFPEEFVVDITQFEKNILDKLKISNIITLPKSNGISLNLINKDLSDHLLSCGFYVSNWQKNSNILIQHFVSSNPNHYNSKYKILIQPLDGTKISKGQISNINLFDIVITPSSIGKELLIENGIIKPIEVVPNYWSDIESSNWFEKNIGGSDKFTFYNESTGIKRKNVENILLYFLKTFTSDDNVRLVIKTDKSRVGELSDILNKFSNIPEVVIIDRYLDQCDMVSIMKGIDCYISLSYMEGFCIPLINALKLGKKIITLRTKISGYVDFINDNNSFLIDCNPIKIDQKFESLLIWSDESIWEEPNYNQYSDMLRYVLSNNKKILENLDRFSKKMIMSRYVEIINRLWH